MRSLAVPVSLGALLVGTAGLVASATAGAAVPAKKHHQATAKAIPETLVLLSDPMVGKDSWPEYVGGSHVTWPANSTIDLTVYAYDDGATALPKDLAYYHDVRGTVGNSEQADGKTITSVNNATISHTFTVPGISLNLPIPVAPTVKAGAIRTPVVVTAVIHTGKAGTYKWQCYVPCGSGASGTGGSMETSGYMTGTVEIG